MIYKVQDYLFKDLKHVVQLRPVTTADEWLFDALLLSLCRHSCYNVPLNCYHCLFMIFYLQYNREGGPELPCMTGF